MNSYELQELLHSTLNIQNDAQRDKEQQKIKNTFFRKLDNTMFDLSELGKDREISSVLEKYYQYIDNIKDPNLKLITNEIKKDLLEYLKNSYKPSDLDMDNKLPYFTMIPQLKRRLSHLQDNIPSSSSIDYYPTFFLKVEAEALLEHYQEKLALQQEIEKKTTDFVKIASNNPLEGRSHSHDSQGSTDKSYSSSGDRDRTPRQTKSAFVDSFFQKDSSDNYHPDSEDRDPNAGNLSGPWRNRH